MASTTMVWLHRYGALLRAASLIDLQYRASIGIWMLWGILEPMISLGIWWSIAAGGAVQGFATDDFARYFFAITLINQMTVAWDAWNLDNWIRGGALNLRLARPMAPIHEALSDNLAFKAQGTVVICSAWIAIAIFWPAVRLPFEPERWALTLLAVIPAAGIRFLSSYATGLLAFWMTRATAVADLQFSISLFLSGRIAPLELLPPQVQAIAHWTWFPGMIGFPAEVLTGRISSPGGFWGGFAIQLAWLAVWWGIYRALWARGLKRYAAVGG